MLTLPETARPRHRLHLSDFAVETFTPLDEPVVPRMWGAQTTGPEAAGCPECVKVGKTNNNQCASGGNENCPNTEQAGCEHRDAPAQPKDPRDD